jgi:hypothetical protein
MPKINTIKPEVFNQKTTILYEDFLKGINKKEEEKVEKTSNNKEEKTEEK